MIYCDSCGIAIHWLPTVIGEHTYCCTGCAGGGPCTCDYDRLPRREERAAMVMRKQRSENLVKQEHDRPQEVGDEASSVSH